MSYSTISINSSTALPIQNNGIVIHKTGTTTTTAGDMKITGDLFIGERSLTVLLTEIERRLAIMHRNIELEYRWSRLHELAEEYKKLETELIEKEKIISILNK